jgi:hypothetical protein
LTALTSCPGVCAIVSTALYPRRDFGISG